jgi:hypothetical protein
MHHDMRIITTEDGRIKGSSAQNKFRLRMSRSARPSKSSIKPKVTTTRSQINTGTDGNNNGRRSGKGRADKPADERRRR